MISKNDTESKEASHDVNDTKKIEYLSQAHYSSQKKTTHIVIPIIVSVFAIVAFIDVCWQNSVALIGVIFFQIFSLWTLKFTSKKNFKKSSTWTMVVSIAFITFNLLLIKGFTATGVIAIMAFVINASMYAKRNIIVGVICCLLSIICVQIAVFLDLFEMKTMSHFMQFVVSLILNIILFIRVFMYLAQNINLNDNLFLDIQNNTKKQHQIIRTIEKMQPVLHRAVSEISEISTGLAAQANQQALATTEVSTTVSKVMQSAMQTAQTASTTFEIAEKTKEELLKNSDRVQKVEHNFKNVVKKMESSKEEIDNLARQIDQIEEILKANRSIGENIKVLSVNTAIEAAKAGEFGVGIQVVASELRDMIHSTEENIIKSYSFLERIRTNARNSAESIKYGVNDLVNILADFQATGNTIEKSVNSFVQTSISVKQINYAAKDQQVGISEVETTMHELDSAASHLNQSVSVLLKSVNDIGTSQFALYKALDK